MMHYLIHRVTFSNGQYGHRVVTSGSRGFCETQKWFTDHDGVRGPTIVRSELMVLPERAWQAILNLQVRRRGGGYGLSAVPGRMSGLPMDSAN